MMRTGVLLSLLFLQTAALSISKEAQPLSSTNVLGSKERPVMKVVRLLKDMEVELQKSLEDDKAVHEMLSCWCEKNRKEKTAAIEAGEAKEAQLKAFIGETWATIQDLQVKRKDARDELYRDQKALDEAKAMRMKENKEFHKEETFLQEAIDAAGQAIVVLGVHHPELAQVRSAAHLLQTANVIQFMPSSSSLRQDQMRTLKEFIQQPEASSFLAIPGFKSYSPQSGQIFGILKQMKADFENSLQDAQKKEEQSKAEFQALKAAKEDEIEAGEKAVASMGQQIADHTEKHAVAIKELEDTQAQLELDRAFLANLEKKCAETNEEFDRRMRARNAEIVAVQDTIGILNTDQAFDNFDNTVNTAEPTFLQTAEAAEQAQRLKQVSTLLQKAAARTGAPKLALLAVSAQLDTFTKVKAEIDKMIKELTKQNEDEIKHRDWCIDELNTNERDTADADHRKNNLLAKIEDLKKTIASLTADIEHETKTIAEMQEQMKRASENREAANADYQTTIQDQRLTQAILNKALARMQKVYAEAVYDKYGRRTQLIQQPGAAHIATSGNHTDAGNGPARFTKYEEHSGGDRVCSMLDEIIADSVKMENEAIDAEEDAQTAYEDFMKESNTGITARTKAINHMTEARAKAKEELSMAKSDLSATVKELEGLYNYNGDLHKSCDYILNNFDARQSARTAEIDALNEAKAILSGMK